MPVTDVIPHTLWATVTQGTVTYMLSTVDRGGSWGLDGYSPSGGH